MLIHNANLSNNALNTPAHNDDIFSPNSALFSRLSMLSKKPSWLLFTAGATLPTTQELSTFGIEAHKVIKIKESNSMSEKEIIIKALSAKNASAIVASDHFSTYDKEILKSQARQNGCEIFFMDPSIQQTLTRQLH